MEQSSSNQKRQLIAALAVLLVIVVIVTGTIIANRKNNDATTQSTTVSSSDTAPASSSPSAGQATTTPSTQTNSSGDYKDGSYQATGSYSSPGGLEKITVNVTLKGDTVTASSAQSQPTDSTAESFQNQFIQAYKQLVIGKDIDSIKLDHVSGSSLTSQGFNEALRQIKQQAHS